MSVKSKLQGLEKKWALVLANCPLCRKRPMELVYAEDKNSVPPSTAPRCPCCGKRPQRIIVVEAVVPLPSREPRPQRY